MGTKELAIRQWKHIKEGGVAAVAKKSGKGFRLIAKFLGETIQTIIFLPVYLLMEIISPILLIRIGELETRSIGQSSITIEIYLCEQAAGIYKLKRRHIDVWFPNKKIANAVLIEKWREKYLTIVPRLIFEPLFYISRWAPGGRKHLVPYRHWLDRPPGVIAWQITDIHDVLPVIGPRLSFTEAEIRESESVLSSLGLTETDKFICFTARNPAYLGETEFGPRDSSIYSQIPAMEALIESGYKAVRVGAAVSEKIDHPDKNIIDYSLSGKRSELLDLYLISKCRFMLSTGTGIDFIATLFRLPALYVNVCDYAACTAWNGKYMPLFTPKKFMRIADQSILSFSEVYTLGVDLFANPDRFENTGLTWVDNTADEITETTLELESLISGTWKETEEDARLQAKFWEIFSRFRGESPRDVRVGAFFLRKNQHLLS